MNNPTPVPTVELVSRLVYGLARCKSEVEKVSLTVDEHQKRVLDDVARQLGNLYKISHGWAIAVRVVEMDNEEGEK